MNNPNVCILRTAGTNCDRETAYAFSKLGANVDLVHINKLLADKKILENYHILAIPGGFTYGDDIAAGKVLANELKVKMATNIKKFIAQGKLIIGICNGFQVLVKSGFLPGNEQLQQETSLIINDSGVFQDKWVYLRKVTKTPSYQVESKCVWVKELPSVIYLPIAHGEGKFVTIDDMVLRKLRNNGQIVFQYCNERGELAGFPSNPNGSVENIAGICDDTGRILGLMPHPERHFDSTHHPRWQQKKNSRVGDGFFIFNNGVEFARKNL